MARLTGGEALVKSLLAHGLDTLYALPGVQLDAFFNALHDEGDRLHVIHTRHEQGAGYMALGHALATGGIGAYAVVPGPGLLNTFAALATAYSTGARVLCLSGQVPSAQIGRGTGMLHEVPAQLAMMQNLTKWAARINHPGEAPGQVAEAFRQLRSGRPRPVGLEMAPDQLEAAADMRLAEPQPLPPQQAPDEDALREAAKLLAGAEAPLIVVGGGAQHAGEEVRELAEQLQAPVSAYRMGKGVLSDEHPLSVSDPVGRQFWAEADVVLAVGTRLQQHRMTWGTDADLKVIHIDIDGAELNRIAAPTIGIAADARQALGILLRELGRAGNRTRPGRQEAVRERKAAMRARMEREFAPQMAYLDALRAALDPGGILVDELTQVGYVGRLAWPAYEPRTYISAGYQGTLGWGLATSIGVQVGRPERQVLSINGDGGFMYNVQELATAVQHNVPLVCVVFNDNGYGNVRRMQEELYGGRVIGSDLRNPDFVKLAESFGAAGYRAESPQELTEALKDAFRHGGPALVEAPVGKMSDPWALIRGERVRPRQN